MSARRSRAAAQGVTLGLLLAAAPLGAQSAARLSAPADSAAPAQAWLARVGVSAHGAELRPSGGSELFALLDRALDPGAGALRPRLAGGALHVRLTDRWRVRAGGEGGGRTVASVSRALPESGPPEVRQQTTFELGSLWYAGAEWEAARWRGAAPGAPDRLRLVLGAGGGLARYRLRQWGGFVDADRRVAYEDDFVSSGRGSIGYASAAIEVPLRSWLALQGELRQQVGSAPMRGDYAGFDRLDLGGTRIGVGVVVHPMAHARP